LRGTVPGHEIEYPMAIVIIGGLVSSTFLTLIVLPVLYEWFGRRLEPHAPAESCNSRP
jgi:Cu/Ag efflux pump CusA